MMLSEKTFMILIVEILTEDILEDKIEAMTDASSVTTFAVMRDASSATLSALR
jgi:hypothetical protein